MVDYMDLSFSRICRKVPVLDSEISYLIDIPSIKGKFRPDLAIRLGVPRVATKRDL